MSWYDILADVESRGSQAERPGSLAGLAAARRVHLGQFFTPFALSKFMWRLVEPAMETSIAAGKQTISLLDNSVGSGRLVQFAEPGKHVVYGVDVDESLIAMLGKHAQESGFECEFVATGMESIKPHGFDIGLINPPFSVTLSSPLLEPYPCTCYGKYGPNTSALSQAYALAQAVDACQVVVALLPSAFAEEVAAKPEDYLPYGEAERLRAIITLPAGLFREENTDVRVSLLVVNKCPCKFERYQIQSLDDKAPDLGLVLYDSYRNTKLGVRGIDDDGPSITRAVTGNNVVRVSHDSRRIIMSFACGLTEAKVMNAVMISRLADEGRVDHRRPKGFQYSGQGVLDIEVHLAQDDPKVSFQNLIGTIEKAGGKPVVANEVWQYLERRIRKSGRQSEPLRHTVYVPEGVAGQDKIVTGRARKPHVVNPKVWGSPFIAPSQEISFIRQDTGGYLYELSGRQFNLSSEELYERFEVYVGAAEPGWTVVHSGLVEKYPVVAQHFEKRATALGIDKWLTWGFQWHDLIETVMKPKGCIVAWEMGLGKARLGSAIIKLIGTRCGLIAVEGGLMDEMERELKGLPIPSSDWQIITSVEQLSKLRQINVISYERLRMQINNSRDTYASRLRRRIGVLVADEGDLLANPESDQSRALWKLSPKRRYILTATPLANYPRDVLPVMVYTTGDGTAAQPWGWYRGLLERNWRNSVTYAKRGIDAFREKFVTMEWCTREFEDTMTEGAKREIPKIANIEEYRAMLAPHIKRRLIKEPEVEEHVKIPPEHRSIVEVPWDDEHLAFYMQVAEEFSSWYMSQRRDDGKRSNLIALLARIRAVSFASDFPQNGIEGFGAYHGLTSKQRWVIDELENLANQGRKTILYAENPGMLDLLGRELDKRGVDNVVFHGKKTIRRRTRELNERFRFGKCPLLLASLGVTQKGLNLWQAKEVIMLSRSWSATVEEQAIARPLRPQQTENIRVRYLHLPGGIDVYKDQLVTFKRDSAKAGLDWGTPQTDGVDFLHMDTLMGRFAEDMAKMHQVHRLDLRKALAGGVYA